MGKKKQNKRHLTIEGQLENHYLGDRHTERNEILWHAWCQNKRWLSQLLDLTMSSFPTYSRHDESHALTVLHNIEMILGEERIRMLSASDCFMILHTVYIHDIGMVITHTDRLAILQNEEFITMVQELEEDSDPVFQKAIKALQQTEYTYDEENKEERMKKLYADKLAVYYAILHLISHFRRTEHGNLSKDRLSDWTLRPEKLGAGFSMAGIPQRIFLLIAKCAGLHTDMNFDHIMELPQEDNGYVFDYLHPRFVAVLLQLGDILDMDNDRFHPLAKELVGFMPELSEHHYKKHQAIRRLYIRPDIISIEADCETQESLLLIRKECDMLKDILKEAGYNWMLICPRNFSGALPTINSVKLYLRGVQIPEDLIITRFRISQSKAFAILEGSNVNTDQFVFLLEFLQNAIDASKMQYWQECIRMQGYYRSKETLKRMPPDEMEAVFSTSNFPIEIRMQIVKQSEKGETTPVTEEDIKKLREGLKEDCQYGVNVQIKDFGTGIDKEDILSIANGGSSRKRERYIINEMPEWLRPMSGVGIGLQSAFILSNTFKCRTLTRSRENYEISFSTVKTNHYDRYINVQPVLGSDAGDDTYGTCFEIFISEKKRLLHEMRPAAWDGNDYFEEDYEALRPLFHSAELLAQMALYLDEQIGEQWFPVHFRVAETPGITIPLNQTEKNQLKKLKHSTENKEKWYDFIKECLSSFSDKELPENMETAFSDRIWNSSGKSWIFYVKEKENREILKNKNALVIKTNHSTGLLDCWNGHLYFWNDTLCVFCLINMENFLRRAYREMEHLDNRFEHVSKGVLLYYKGIKLEEMELPDLGNELIQSIDIQRRLDGEYINLSRRGFTEKGRMYFLNNIYPALIESLRDILREMNREQPGDVIKLIQSSLDQKKELIDFFEEHLKNDKLENSMRQELREAKDKLNTLFKENVVTVTMLAFFAQERSFSPLLRTGGRNSLKKRCCWSEVLEIMRTYGEKLREQSEKREVLFQIKLRSKVDLLNQKTRGTEKPMVTFADVFSDNNHFMIISRRENAVAPWKQYLSLIHETGKDNQSESFIDELKRYILMDNNSEEKKDLGTRLQKAGEDAIKKAKFYDRDSIGENGELSSDEYRQQFFLMWMLQYIPTVALFVSEDGNTRVNIIHGSVFPYIYVNDSLKALVLQRVLDNSERYGIQRFSIPVWQHLEYLKCDKLPYSHYFVKRGYMARKSYGEVIFPFGKEELTEISRRINSPHRKANLKKLMELFESLNVQRSLAAKINCRSNELKKQMEEICKMNEIDFDWVRAETLQNEGRKEPNLGYEIREEYRSFTARCLMRKEESRSPEKFSFSDFLDYKKEVDEISGCILLKIIGDYLSDDRLGYPLLNCYDKGCEYFTAAWRYVLKKEYISEFLQVRQYKEEYLDELFSEKGSAYQKQKRIVEYIANNNGYHLRSRDLWDCWVQYIEELFGIFEKISIGALSRPEYFVQDIESISRRTGIIPD